MPFSTYAELKTAIIDELDRDDLTTKVDDFIDLAEERHKNEIRIRQQIKRSRVSASDRYLALPSGFLDMATFRVLTNPVTILDQVSLHEMNRQRQEIDGIPSLFTIHEEIEFDVGIDDTSPLTMEMIYYAEFTALSDSNTSNGLLTRAPATYLYGSLVSAAPWLSEDERLQTWNDLYNLARDGLTIADRRSRHSGPLFSAVAGATP